MTVTGLGKKMNVPLRYVLKHVDQRNYMKGAASNVHGELERKRQVRKFVLRTWQYIVSAAIVVVAVKMKQC